MSVGFAYAESFKLGFQSLLGIDTSLPNNAEEVSTSVIIGFDPPEVLQRQGSIGTALESVSHPRHFSCECSC